MNHVLILPILLPMGAALLQLAAGRRGLRLQRAVGLIVSAVTLAAALWLATLADAGGILTYALGGWPAPFGIVLVGDRLSTMLVLLTMTLASVCLLFASGGGDAEGRHFHPLFQLQVMGINGAFLTGDLFNLFVFFEVMLLASYALLTHGGGLPRTRAGFAYVALNLAGSALFLIALGLFYGALGTLNLADIALRLQTQEVEHSGLIRLAGALLITVFALKSALAPLFFWLPHAYTAASAAVAALFVIMTKVGVVAILRVQAVALAPAPATSDLLNDWLTLAALATIAFAMLGSLAASRLRALAAYLVLASAGALLWTPAFAEAAVTAAALFYLVQSTLAGAALFLIAELAATARGRVEDYFAPGKSVNSTLLSVAFLIIAATIAGLPPLPGFLGKLMLLRAVQDSPLAAAIWTTLLVMGFVAMAVFARAGSVLFWEGKPSDSYIAWDRRHVWATSLLVAAAPLLALWAQPLSAYASRTAAQLHAPGAYVTGVLGDDGGKIQRNIRP